MPERVSRFRFSAIQVTLGQGDYFILIELSSKACGRIRDLLLAVLVVNTATVWFQIAQSDSIRIGENIGDVEKILTDLTVSRSEISTQMTPAAIDENYVYTANIEPGVNGDVDGVGLHTVVRQGQQQADGSWLWMSALIEDRTVFDEYHTAPSVGIDETGHLHVAYNMHNIPWQYKRMSDPHDLSSFTFQGQFVSLAEIERWKFQNKTNFPTLGTADIPGTQITYPHFSVSNTGQLYVAYRFANRPKRVWPERTLGVGIAKYDDVSNVWLAIGSPLAVSTEDYEFDAQAPTQPVPYAAQQGWTGYAPRLMFGPQNQLHVLSFWREGTPGATLSRPCHLYSNDDSSFSTLEGVSESLPLTPDRCGNTGFPSSQGFYTVLDTAMDALGNPFHVVSPVGSSRKLVTFEASTRTWVQENTPGNASEIFFDASDNLWAIANGPVVYRRDKGSNNWTTVYSDTNADNCLPKATLASNKTTAVIHAQSCDQTSVTLYGIRIGLDEPDTDTVLLAPAPGGVLDGESETFEWNEAANEYWLYVGSTEGGRQFHDSGSLGAQIVHSVGGLPTNGSQLYVRLYYRSGAQESWQYIDETYTAATLAPDVPEISSPVEGTTLAGSIQEFSWDYGLTDVDAWWLYAGSGTGTRNYFDSGLIEGSDVRSVVASQLPLGNISIHVRLWFKRTGSGWESVDSEFVAGIQTGDVPEVIAPLPNSTLSGTTTEFNWVSNGTAVSQWWLYLGTEPGKNNLHDSGASTSLFSGPITGLPSNGSDVHVRLWYQAIGGTWDYTDSVYTASGSMPPDFVSPLSGSTLSGSTQAFSWDSNGTNIDEWWLFAGSTPNGREYFNSGSIGAVTELMVINLPIDGSEVYVTLWFRQGASTWYSRSRVYYASQ